MGSFFDESKPRIEAVDLDHCGRIEVVERERCAEGIGEAARKVEVGDEACACRELTGGLVVRSGSSSPIETRRRIRGRRDTFESVVGVCGFMAQEASSWYRGHEHLDRIRQT